VFGKTQRGVSERPNKPKKPLIPKWLGTLVAILAVLCRCNAYALETLATCSCEKSDYF
jgi:hypothetical protein